MFLKIDDLRQFEFQISGINIIHQKPSYRKFKTKCRHANGFLYIIDGSCRYMFSEGSFVLEPRSLVYLPSGSVHRMEVLTEGIEFYRIDFTLTIDRENILFSKLPMLVCQNAPQECVDAIHHLAEKHQFINDFVAKMELMCRIFRSIQKDISSAGKKKLYPAVRFLSRNLTEKVSVNELAAMCYLSKSRFYELFTEEYGMPPMVFKDQLLMERAQMFLQNEELTVTEIAEELGFESVSYFSRFFKKHQGISPSEYAKR